MGVLFEEAYLGTLFLVAAIWWTVQISKRFYFYRQRQLEFSSKVSYPCCFFRDKFQLEPVLKTAFGIVGLVLQSIESSKEKTGKNSEFAERIRLIPVYIIITISGLYDIIKKTRLLTLKKLDWILLGFTYLILAVVFANPIGLLRSDFFALSQLQQVLALVAGVFVFVEAFWNQVMLVSFARAYFTMLLGSWTWHIGVTVSIKLSKLENYPTSDTEIFTASFNELDLHTRVQLVSLYFTWHCGVVLILQLCIWMITIMLIQNNHSCCKNDISQGMQTAFQNRAYLEEIDITADL